MEIPGEISLLCRLCLANDEVNVPIFGEQSDIRQISLKISSCLPVKIAADDLLPKNICEGCSDKLELLYTFSKTSQEAEKKLLVWVEQVSVNNASEAITAVAKQIVDSTEVKEESDEGHKVNVKKSFDELVEDAEEKEPESEAPPPKRARRTAAVKAQISISQESEDEDDVDMVEPLTKVEDESEVSDSESVEPHSSFVDVPGTSADEQQPGPSGVQKDGADAPVSVACATALAEIQKDIKNLAIYKHYERKRFNRSYQYNCKHCNYLCHSLREITEHVILGNALGKLHGCGVKEATMSPLEEIDNYLKCLRRDPSVTREQFTKIKAQFYVEFPKCVSCNEKFKNSELLQAHIKTEHRSQLRYCCKQVFLTEEAMQIHRHVHTIYEHYERRNINKTKCQFQCRHCDHKCESLRSIREHVNDEHASLDIENIREYACSYCNYTVFSPESLQAHVIATHEEHYDVLSNALEKIHTCKFCSMTTTNQASMINHVRFTHLYDECSQSAFDNDCSMVEIYKEDAGGGEEYSDALTEEEVMIDDVKVEKEDLA